MVQILPIYFFLAFIENRGVVHILIYQVNLGKMECVTIAEVNIM